LPVIRSYLRYKKTNFYSLISNCDKVMPYEVRPPSVRFGPMADGGHFEHYDGGLA